MSGELPKVLVIAPTGMLGTDLMRVLAASPIMRTVGMGRDKIDITKGDQVKRTIEQMKPAVVVNAAAFTDVDGAEREREKAFKVNVEGPKNLAEGCGLVGAKLVHFSTDQVFDGSGTKAWTEDSPTNPLNYYAETKLSGEQEALRHDDSLVLRVQWLYGQKKDRFTPLRDKELFTPFADQYGAPTWTVHIAEAVKNLIQRDQSGLYHFSYDDFASWADVFRFVREELNLKVRLEPKQTDEVKLPARRPKFSVLSNRKLLGALGVESLGSWRMPLRQFLKRRS